MDREVRKVEKRRSRQAARAPTIVPDFVLCMALYPWSHTSSTCQRMHAREDV